jgi:hypothetical protein
MILVNYKVLGVNFIEQLLNIEKKNSNDFQYI